MSKPSLSAKSKVRLHHIVVGLIVAALLLVFTLLPRKGGDLVSITASRLSDTLLLMEKSIFGPRDLNSEVMAISISDTDLEKLGENFYGRKLTAATLQRLADVGVRGVLVDILFSLEADPANDPGITAAIESLPNVWLASNLRYDPRGPRARVQDFYRLRQKGDPLPVESIVYAQQSFLDAGARSGHIYITPDADGVYRRYHPFLKPVQKAISSSLSVQAALDILYGEENTTPDIVADGIWGKRDLVLRDGSELTLYLPLDEDGTLPLPLARTWSESATSILSLSDLLDTDPDVLSRVRDLLDRKYVVLLDASSSGKDTGTTILESFYPLGGLHLNILSDLLSGRVQTWMPSWISFLIASLGALSLYLLWLLRSWVVYVFGSMLTIVAAFVALLLATHFGAMSPDVFPVFFTLGSSVILLLAERAIRENQIRLRERERLGQFFAPSVVQKILEGTSPLQRAERKMLSIMFTDIVGFTSWSSDKEPEYVRSVLNRYFELMTEIVFSNGGTVDKYIGDGMLVFFGDPLKHSDDGLRALKTALGMQSAAERLRKSFALESNLDLRVRVGIHRGEAIVGGIGTQTMMQYTVLGAAVNLAQRLEGGAEPGSVLISEPLGQNAGLTKADLAKEITSLFDYKVRIVSRSITPKGYTSEMPCIQISIEP